MQIEAAREKHAPGIVAIYNEAVTSSVATFDTRARSEREMRAWLRGHDSRHPVLVATEQGRVIGWISLSKWSDRGAYGETAEISVYVQEGWRGRGIGRALMSQVLEAGRSAGLHTVLARIAGDNAVSVRLHEAAGFAPIGTMREVGHKFGRYVDVHLMQIML